VVPPTPWICAGEERLEQRRHAMALRWEEGFTSLNLGDATVVATLPALGR